MSETKFTPGPWFIDGSGNISNTVKAVTGEWQLGEYAETVCSYQSALGPGTHTHDAEVENSTANAHLIAAAPELYEALEQAFSVLEREYGRAVADVNMPLALPALAKARGE